MVFIVACNILDARFSSVIIQRDRDTPAKHSTVSRHRVCFLTMIWVHFNPVSLQVYGSASQLNRAGTRKFSKCPDYPR
jgi:hypothetical protein